MFGVAERFYLLFQQHTTKEMAVQHGFFGLPCVVAVQWSTLCGQRLSTGRTTTSSCWDLRWPFLAWWVARVSCFHEMFS